MNEKKNVLKTVRRVGTDVGKGSDRFMFRRIKIIYFINLYVRKESALFT